MKKTIIATSFLLLLTSCSVTSNIKMFRPKNVKSYEITSQYVYFETQIYSLKLYDKKGRIKDSVSFVYDIESEKLVRVDKNGNHRINTKFFKSIKLPKYYSEKHIKAL